MPETTTAATPPAAQTGGERERLAGCFPTDFNGYSDLCEWDATLTAGDWRAILAALDRGAADARTVAGLVEHKGVLMDGLIGLAPHAVVRAAVRAVSALPEQEASNG